MVKNILAPAGGSPNGKIRSHWGGNINQQLMVYGASLAEPYKGSVYAKHKITLNDGRLKSVFLSRALRGEYGFLTPHPNRPNSYGFDINKPSLLYFIRVDVISGQAYKIGITNNSVKKRYYGEGVSFQVIKEFSSHTGKDARQTESLIIKTYKGIKYCGVSPFNCTGTKEMLCEDISNDYKFSQIIDKSTFH